MLSCSMRVKELRIKEQLDWDKGTTCQMAEEDDSREDDLPQKTPKMTHLPRLQLP